MLLTNQHLCFLLLTVTNFSPLVTGDQWWKLATTKSGGGRVPAPSPTTPSKSTPGPPVPATTSTSGGRCTCQCEAPKIIRVEIPKLQIKYIPVVVKSPREETTTAPPTPSYKEQQLQQHIEEIEMTAMTPKSPPEPDMPVMKYPEEEVLDEADHQDSYARASRLTRFGVSYVGRLGIVLILTHGILCRVQEIEEFDEEETRTTRTFAERSGSEQQVVTGTFRFRKVVSGDSGEQNGRQVAGNRNGWEVAGCYCRDGVACNCNNNPNRIRMFVKSPPRQRPTRGPDLTVSDDVDQDNRDNGDLEQSGRLRSGGCTCNANGCDGNMCGSMNGCVCNANGNCWGSACASRIPTSVGSQLANPMAGMNPLAALIQPVNTGQSSTIPPITINGAAAGDCSCTTTGCTGNGCAQMNGCFCVGNSCWGSQCRAPVTQQTNGMSNAGLLNTGLAGLGGTNNLVNALAALQLSSGGGLGGLNTGLNGMQSARQIQAIPGLGGGVGGGLGGIGGAGVGLGGIGGSGIGLGGDLSGLGGGMIPFGGQAIPVVQGIPIQRFRGQLPRGVLRQHSNSHMVAVPGRGRRRKVHRPRGRPEPERSSTEKVKFTKMPTSISDKKATGMSLRGYTNQLADLSQLMSSSFESQSLTLPTVSSASNNGSAEPSSKLGAIQKSLQDSVAKLFKKSFTKRKGSDDQSNENDEDDDENDDDNDEAESSIKHDFVQPPISNQEEVHYWNDWSNKIIDIQL
ncbi:hypothetical protein HDE_05409 [Halotydeus destructor]|nr:hypothetical protein HDE_05409 [Halotydeus destructor]